MGCRGGPFAKGNDSSNGRGVAHYFATLEEGGANGLANDIVC